MLCFSSKTCLSTEKKHLTAKLRHPSIVFAAYIICTYPVSYTHLDFGFTGHLYVLNDSTYAVQKCTMNLPKKTGVNFVNRMDIVQQYEQLSLIHILVLFILIALVIAAIGYLFASLMRFAISRKREYMADAGSAEMTKNPLALANALRKISADPAIEAVERKDVAQLFIQNPQKASKSIFSGLSGLFATHPPIEKRIEILEQF